MCLVHKTLAAFLARMLMSISKQTHRKQMTTKNVLATNAGTSSRLPDDQMSRYHPALFQIRLFYYLPFSDVIASRYFLNNK